MTDVWDEMDEAARRIEREARREQVAAEADARQLHLAKRTLVGVAWEAMQQGRVVRLRWIGGELAGVPTAAVEDLIIVRNDADFTGVNVAALSSMDVGGDPEERGLSGDRTLASFLAWCRMIESRKVTVRALGGRIVDGILVAAASDHVLVKTNRGDEIALAIQQVAAISVVGDPFLAL